MEWNLLGCNVLADLCCIVSLDRSSPTLTVRQPASVAWDRALPTATITLAGHALQVIPDTGTSAFLLCDLVEVVDAPLDIQDVPDDLCVTTTNGPQKVMFKAVGAPVRLSGRERRGTVFLCETQRALVGMELLLGAVLRFGADGSFDLHVPRESLDPQRQH